MDSKLPIDSKFIGDVYAVSLKPNNYDELIAGWDQLLSTVVHAQNLSASDLLDDVESKPVTDLTTLEPHFDRSYSALLRIGREPTPLDLIHLDPRPCFGISTSGRVTQINQRAHSLYPKILDENINSLIESDHHLVLTDALTTMSKEDLSGKHVENLEGLASKQSVVANLTLVSPETGETGLFALMPLKAHADNDDTIARLVSVDLSWNETIGSWMKTAFDLSSAEVEVLRTLVSGHTLSELAAEKARSIETIRTQLKSLLRKTKLSSQIELIRLFSGFSLVPPELEAMKADKPTFRSYSNAITLPDGRVMQVDEFGPCSGQPVLFLHGMLDGTEPTTIAKNLLIERNIRMICPWRPGFAGSSPHECETSVAPKAFAEDLKFLATELGLPR